MIDPIILWKGDVHATDDGFKVPGNNFLKQLNIFLGNVIDFKHRFSYFESDRWN